MKTALQEVFSELERLHPSLFDIYTQQGREFVNNFHKFLELEKQQIIEAHGNKLKKSKGDTNYEYWLTGEMYYEQTFPLNQNRMKTAVEWLVEAMYQETYPFNPKYSKIFEQAKEMEKEQIMDAYRINPNNENWSNSGIDYYKETFKSE